MIYDYLHPGPNFTRMMTSTLPFNGLFAAIASDALTAVHATILRLKKGCPDQMYNLLNQGHPEKKLTALQFAVINYPRTSIRVIGVLLDYGAGTELPIDFTEHNDLESNMRVSPLWIAVREKHPLELVELLLAYKADVFFKYRFDEDEKNDDGEGAYSLLHLAVKIGANEEIVKLLVNSTKSLLLNDRDNQTCSTPLILAVEGNNLELVKLLKEFGADLMIRNREGLTVYETASKSHSIPLCLLLRSEDPDPENHYFWYLEVLELIGPSTWQSQTDLRIFRDLDEAADELLPMEGLWEWTDTDWIATQEGKYFCRLRRLIEISAGDQSYLKESIDLVLSDDHSRALKVLLEGLQRENDGEKKRRAAGYFQRLLQRSGTPTLGLLDNLSRSNLVIFSDSHRDIHRDKDVRNVHSDEEEESDDSLLYCPVCSHRFIHNDRQSHLSSCLNSPAQPLIANRYTRSVATTTVPAECPICYEDLNEEESVVMNCLCRFHEKCIEEWLGRGKQCPFHQE